MKRSPPLPPLRPTPLTPAQMEHVFDLVLLARTDMRSTGAIRPRTRLVFGGEMVHVEREASGITGAARMDLLIELLRERGVDNGVSIRCAAGSDPVVGFEGALVIVTELFVRRRGDLPRLLNGFVLNRVDGPDGRPDLGPLRTATQAFATWTDQLRRGVQA
jgi:hypothetical protein